MCDLKRGDGGGRGDEGVSSDVVRGDAEKGSCGGVAIRDDLRRSLLPFSSSVNARELGRERLPERERGRNISKPGKSSAARVRRFCLLPPSVSFSFSSASKSRV